LAAEQPVERPARKPDETRAATSVDVHVGQRLRAQRLLIGMSQEQLAGLLGVSFQQLQKYEKGANRISASRLYHAAQLLRAPILWFFEGLGGVNRDTQRVQDRMTSNDPEVLRFVHVTRRISDPNRRRRLRAFAALLAKANDE
jgi:transcriptional regulator with XRE-family HTH domain